jgi:hypothetical protein
LLNVEPKMLYRLDIIEVDLTARQERAEQEGWLGEIEGIELTLSALRAKRDDVNGRRRLRFGNPSVGSAQRAA